jgi:hypothetical protein
MFKRTCLLLTSLFCSWRYVHGLRPDVKLEVVAEGLTHLMQLVSLRR